MGVRRCSGFAEEDGTVVGCCFNHVHKGQQAQGKFQGKCMWCSPARLESVCQDVRKRKSAASLLVLLYDSDYSGAFSMAAERLSMHEGGDDVIQRASDSLSYREEMREEPPTGGSSLRAEAERFAEEWAQKQQERQRLRGSCPFASQARRERAAVQEFMSKHDIPTEQSVLEWLSRSSCGRQIQLASDIQSARQAEALLDYNVLKNIWSMLAGHALESKEAVQAAREAGLMLHARGEQEGRGAGHKCLQFHYYVLHYMIAGGSFHPRPQTVIEDYHLAVAVLTCHKDFVAEYWNGIGEWTN